MTTTRQDPIVNEERVPSDVCSLCGIYADDTSHGLCEMQAEK